MKVFFSFFYVKNKEKLFEIEIESFAPDQETLTPAKKLIVARQVPDRFPGEWSNFKVYHQRVNIKQYVNIFICNKPTIFFPDGTSLFKVIKNRADHCTNVFIPNTEQPGAETKENSISIVLKQSLYHSGIQKSKKLRYEYLFMSVQVFFRWF